MRHNIANGPTSPEASILACQRRHNIDSIWFRATESPMKAKVFPLINSKNFLASNRGSSHWEGLQRQFSYSLSGLPFPWQFCICVRTGHVLFAYDGPRESKNQVPRYRSQPTAQHIEEQLESQRSRCGMKKERTQHKPNILCTQKLLRIPFEKKKELIHLDILLQPNIFLSILHLNIYE